MQTKERKAEVFHEDRLYFMVCFCHVPYTPKHEKNPNATTILSTQQTQTIKNTKETYNERKRKQCLQ